MGNIGLGGYRAGRVATSVTALGQGQQPRSRYYSPKALRL